MEDTIAMSNTLKSEPKFYGQFDPPVDKFLYERYFQSMTRPGLLIECGAFDGVLESSCKYFEESLGWSCINIEASPAIFAALERNRPLSRNFNLALTNQDGEAAFVEVSLPGYELCTNGSIKHLQQHRQWLDSVNCTYSTTNVPARTLRQIVEDLAIQRIDLMVLDIEGHELEALEGFHGSRVLPQVLCVEHGHLGIDTVRLAVEQLPYRYDTSMHVNSYFLLNAN